MEAIGGKTVFRVMVVDDHPVVREGLRSMLVGDPQIEFVGEASSGEEAVAKVKELTPDVVFLDIRMPGISGIDAIRQIQTVSPATAIIVLTVYESETYLIEAFRMGVRGFLLKDSPPELLCHAVHVVVHNGTVVYGDLMRQTQERILRSPKDNNPGDGSSGVKERLTLRELDVMRLMAQGHSNKEIAGGLNVSEITVKKHVQNILNKLGTTNRTQATIVALQLGIWK